MTPAKSVAVNAVELRDAFEFVSAGLMYEHSAFICVDTGTIYLSSSMSETEEDLPNDLETSDRYIAIPHKNELGLGRDLALDFIHRELPGDYKVVAGFFRRRGAYSRFKQLLESRGILQRWYDFEDRAAEEALRGRCEENDVRVIGN